MSDLTCMNSDGMYGHGYFEESDMGTPQFANFLH